MPKVCVVLNCKTGTKGVDEKRSLFKPPLNDELRKKWEDAIPGLKELKQTQCVCERHFLKKHVHKKWIKYGEKGNIIAQYEYPRPRLDPRAVPCIFEADKTTSLVDAWLVYKQQNGLGSSQVLTNNDSNKIPVNATKTAEEPGKTMVNTIQEVYSTGEHDYCRLELNPSENDKNKDNSSKVIRTKSSSFQVEVQKSTNFQIQGQKAISSLPQGQKSTNARLQGQKAISSQSQNQKSAGFQVHAKKPSSFHVQGPKSTSSESEGQNSAASDNNSLTLAGVEVKQEPIESSMEVEEFIDTFIQPNSSEESSSTSQKAQQITLSTPSGQSEQLTPTGKSQRITLVDNDKQVSTNPPEGEHSKSQLRLETGGVYENGETLAKLPYTWSVSELITNKGKQIVFSHIILVSHNNVETPVLKKSVVLEQRTGNVLYYAHGRVVDVSKTKLPKTTSEITSLPIALYTFQKMRVCGGVTPPNKTPIIKDIYQDLMQCWRHNACKILVERGKCEPCSKLQKTLAQKRRRAEKNTGSLRISSTWDPRDQIVVLKKKLELERRKKIHAQAQVKKLTEASKENGVKVTFVKNITL